MKVGEIKTLNIEEDPSKEGGLFTLELNTRIYTLRAKTDTDAELWVSTLQKLKEKGLPADATKNTDSASKGKSRLLAPEINNRGNWVKEGKYCGCCPCL